MSGERPQIFGKTLFADLLLGMLVVVTALLKTSNAVEQEEQKKKQESSIETDGLYAIVATWPADKNDDVDLWVRDPSGNIIMYRQKTAELMNLEYDDQGDIGDRAMTSTGIVKADINRERAIIRAGMPGEYAVDVHMFAKHSSGPTPVKVALYRLRGDDTEVHVKELMLNENDRPTAFRFVLGPEGDLVSTNELPANLIDGIASQTGGVSLPGGAP